MIKWKAQRKMLIEAPVISAPYNEEYFRVIVPNACVFLVDTKSELFLVSRCQVIILQ